MWMSLDHTQLLEPIRVHGVRGNMPIMKLCRKCNTIKDRCQFSLNRNKSDGLNSQCKLCHKEYAKDHYKDNKSSYKENKTRRSVKYLQEFYGYLKQQCCTDCGNSNFMVLEFDHLHDKSFNISDKVWFTPLNTLMEEISKCEVVCANCHRIRTATRQEQYKYLG